MVLYVANAAAVDEQIRELQKQRQATNKQSGISLTQSSMDSDLYGSTPSHKYSGYAQSISASGEDEVEGLGIGLVCLV